MIFRGDELGRPQSAVVDAIRPVIGATVAVRRNSCISGETTMTQGRVF
jgi:hypothetical protein